MTTRPAHAMLKTTASPYGGPPLRGVTASVGMVKRNVGPCAKKGDKSNPGGIVNGF